MSYFTDTLNYAQFPLSWLGLPSGGKSVTSFFVLISGEFAIENQSALGGQQTLSVPTSPVLGPYPWTLCSFCNLGCFLQHFKQLILTLHFRLFIIVFLPLLWFSKHGGGPAVSIPFYFALCFVPLYPVIKNTFNFTRPTYQYTSETGNYASWVFFTVVRVATVMATRKLHVF